MLAQQELPVGADSWVNMVRNWLHAGEHASNSAYGNKPAHQQVQERRPLSAPMSHAQQLEQLVAQRTSELEKVIAQLRVRQAQLEAQAHCDCLTGLANRKLLQDRFQCAMERAKRSGECFAVLMIDLDGFKAINDTYGHAAGDAVLIAVARRLSAAVRTCDTVARLGGDEFVLIVETIHDAQEVARISRKLARTLSKAIYLDCGTAVVVGASIGLALYPGDGSDLAHILCVADQAMYTCKNTNRMRL